METSREHMPLFFNQASVLKDKKKKKWSYDSLVSSEINPGFSVWLNPDAESNKAFIKCC